ncbi:hypothetical protein EDM68_01460 [Candidatus Uhrbacteria bacterium]|nr:MAG: hypothetical protein EDM68_01460 [Candidatus Uhrbacteria bacterium]
MLDFGLRLLLPVHSDAEATACFYAWQTIAEHTSLGARIGLLPPEFEASAHDSLVLWRANEASLQPHVHRGVLLMISVPGTNLSRDEWMALARPLARYAFKAYLEQKCEEELLRSVVCVEGVPVPFAVVLDLDGAGREYP